jgi:hypothetical protein
VCVAAAIACGLLIEVLITFQSDWPFGHTQLGHVVGWLGLAIILLVFVYSIKKRSSRKTGWPKGWFFVHKVAGIVGPMLILVHAGPHFHALVPMLALVTMGIVVVSGVIGLVVHRQAVGLLKHSRKELLSQGLSDEEVEDRLYGLASGEEIFRVWQMIHAPLVVLFIALAMAHVFGALYFGGV